MRGSYIVQLSYTSRQQYTELNHSDHTCIQLDTCTCNLNSEG